MNPDLVATARPEVATGHPSADEWMPAYLRARALEGRLYPDEIVAHLPSVARSHPLHGEWVVRARSADRLATYLRGLHRPLAIVDAGCGNGWLSNAIARLPGTTVFGLDVNGLELAQATRVFAGRPNLRFVRADLLALADGPRDDGMPEDRRSPEAPKPAGLPAHPDLVVLASVIQYAPDLAALVRGLGSWLADGGEIHILDSPLYRAGDIPAALERTRRHYAVLGAPEMANAYHHHRLADLAGFRPTFLAGGDGETGSLARLRESFSRLPATRRSPFPWIRIRAEDVR